MLLGLRMPDHLMNEPPNISLKSYKKECLENGVIKFSNGQSLIYIKALNFYTPEHNPMICWTSSGYAFKCVNEEMIAGEKICTGILKKDQDTIYTAWWFDNGEMKTISQLAWRWRCLRNNDNFILINVCAPSKAALLHDVNSLSLQRHESFTAQQNEDKIASDLGIRASISKPGNCCIGALHFATPCFAGNRPA
jgi:hypothetical protein